MADCETSRVLWPSFCPVISWEIHPSVFTRVTCSGKYPSQIDYGPTPKSENQLVRRELENNARSHAWKCSKLYKFSVTSTNPTSVRRQYSKGQLDRCQTRTNYTKPQVSNPWSDILKPHSHREKRKLPSFTLPLLHLLSPFPCRGGPSASPAHSQLQPVRDPDSARVLLPSTLGAVSLLFSQEPQDMASRQDLSNSYSCFSLAGFSRKWPWNQFTPQRPQECTTTGTCNHWITAGNKTPQQPNPLHTSRQLPAACWVLSGFFQRQLLWDGISKSTKALCLCVGEGGRGGDCIVWSTKKLNCDARDVDRIYSQYYMNIWQGEDFILGLKYFKFSWSDNV